MSGTAARNHSRSSRRAFVRLFHALLAVAAVALLLTLLPVAVAGMAAWPLARAAASPVGAIAWPLGAIPAFLADASRKFPKRYRVDFSETYTDNNNGDKTTGALHVSGVFTRDITSSTGAAYTFKGVLSFKGERGTAAGGTCNIVMSPSTYPINPNNLSGLFITPGQAKRRLEYLGVVRSLKPLRTTYTASCQGKTTTSKSVIRDAIHSEVGRPYKTGVLSGKSEQVDSQTGSTTTITWTFTPG
jgi:hypothetical protein